MKRSKRYKQTAEKIEQGKTYSIADALQIIKENPVKFDAGIELHMKLGIDPKKSEQLVRGTVLLPNGTGKTKRVIAFVAPDKEAEAKAAGADIIGNEELIAEIQKTQKTDFDVAVATPDMMRKIGSIAKILGQKGLMSNPKTDTVGPDVKRMIEELKKGKIAYRSDDSANVHFLVGRVSFSVEQLQQNITTIIEAVRKAKPSDSKGIYMQTATLTASMGPGIRVTLE